MDTSDDDPERSAGQALPAIPRRSLLASIGTATAAGLAGCSQAQQSYEFTADPVVLGEETRSEQGYVEESVETATAERSQSVAGAEVSVTVHSQVAIYASERETEPLYESGAVGGENALAEWSGGSSVRGVRASEIVDSETLEPRSDAMPVDSIPAEDALVLAPNSRFGGRGDDVLVLVPGERLGSDSISSRERDAHAFDAGSGEFFPTKVALDLGSGVYIGGPIGGM